MAVRQTRNQSGGAKLTQNARAGFLGIAPATILAIGIVALLGLVAGGFLLSSRVDKLVTELAFAKREVESTNERLMSLQREVSQIRQDQSSAAAMIARLNVMRTYPDPLFASNAAGRPFFRFGALSQVVSVSPSTA